MLDPRQNNLVGLSFAAPKLSAHQQAVQDQLNTGSSFSKYTIYLVAGCAAVLIGVLIWRQGKRSGSKA